MKKSQQSAKGLGRNRETERQIDEMPNAYPKISLGLVNQIKVQMLYYTKCVNIIQIGAQGWQIRNIF